MPGYLQRSRMHDIVANSQNTSGVQEAHATYVFLARKNYGTSKFPNFGITAFFAVLSSLSHLHERSQLLLRCLRPEQPGKEIHIFNLGILENFPSVIFLYVVNNKVDEEQLNTLLKHSLFKNGVTSLLKLNYKNLSCC